MIIILIIRFLKNNKNKIFQFLSKTVTLVLKLSKYLNSHYEAYHYRDNYDEITKCNITSSN